MPNPKRRHSKTRTRKRRTHDKVAMPVLAKCPITGQFHRYHHAHWHEEKLYYRGRILIDKTASSAALANAEN